MDMSSKKENHDVDSTDFKEPLEDFPEVDDMSETERYEDAERVAELMYDEFNVGGLSLGTDLERKLYYIRLITKSVEESEEIYRAVEEDLDYKMAEKGVHEEYNYSKQEVVTLGEVWLYFGKRASFDEIEERFEEWDLMN